MTILAPDVNEVKRMAAHEECQDIQFSQAPTQAALHALEEILSSDAKQLQEAAGKIG